MIVYFPAEHPPGPAGMRTFRMRKRSCGGHLHMNILQSLPTQEPFCVSLNQHEKIETSLLHGSTLLNTPPTTGRKSAQAMHNSFIQRKGISLCGAYWGYGFHEDVEQFPAGVILWKHCDEQLPLFWGGQPSPQSSQNMTYATMSTWLFFLDELDDVFKAAGLVGQPIQPRFFSTHRLSSCRNSRSCRCGPANHV